MYTTQRECLVIVLITAIRYRDTCFDAHLFRRLFCLYHVMLCACSDDATTLFFVCKYYCFTMSSKNKCKVRDSKVRNNRICLSIAVWSHFLQNYPLHRSKILPYIKENDKNVLLCQQTSFIFHLVT